MSERVDPSTSPVRYAVEVLLQLVVIYSVVALIVEIEWSGRHPEGATRAFFVWSERVVVTIFTVEYLTRLALARDRRRWIVSPLALIDLAAILPFFLGFLFDVRALRLLRLVRLLKLGRYHKGLNHLTTGFAEVGRELQVVGLLVLFVIIFGSTSIYAIEHRAQPQRFAHFGDAIWWSFVTLTTVGYGDVYPMTTAGRVIAVVLVIAGLGLFGTFISLIGGAFVSAARRQETEAAASHVRLPSQTVELLARHQRKRGEPEDTHALSKLAARLIREQLHQPAETGDEPPELAPDLGPAPLGGAGSGVTPQS